MNKQITYHDNGNICEESFYKVGLGGLRGLVDAPPAIPLIMGAIIGGVSIWVYNTPDDVISVISKEEE